jgi:hypothetical protein
VKTKHKACKIQQWRFMRCYKFGALYGQSLRKVFHTQNCLAGIASTQSLGKKKLVGAAEIK